MITRERVLRKIVKIEDVSRRVRQEKKAFLECGHETYLEFIDGKIIDLRSGTSKGSVWLEYEGDEVGVNDFAKCWECSEKQYKESLATVPIYKAEIFPDQDSLRKIYPKAEWHECGPVHKHDDKMLVQIYLGQHEWLAINTENSREVFEDPGFEGTVYGWGYVPGEHITYAYDLFGINKELEPPYRDGHKAITTDMMLFAEKEKLKEYLGEDDPLSPKD